MTAPGGSGSKTLRVTLNFHFLLNKLPVCMNKKPYTISKSQFDFDWYWSPGILKLTILVTSVM